VRYGQYNERLFARFGDMVRVAYDPDDVTHVLVFDAVTMKIVCQAKANTSVGWAVSHEQLKEAHREQRRARKALVAHAGNARTSHTPVMDSALRAQREQQEPRPKGKKVNIRAVRTPFDDQADTLRQENAEQKRKKAAGADSAPHTTIDLDFSQLQRQRQRQEPSKSLNLDFDLSLLRRDRPDDETDVDLFGECDDGETGNPRRPGA
jgi:hypothetical protein